MVESQIEPRSVLESVYEAAPTLLAVRDRRQLIRTVLELAQRTLRATGGALVLAPWEGAELQADILNPDGQLTHATVTALAQQVMQARHPLCSFSLPADHFSGEGAEIPAGSVQAFPLEVGGVPFGALVLWREKTEAPFTVSDFRAGKRLAAQVAIPLDYARLRQELSSKAQELEAAHAALARVEGQAQAIIAATQEGIVLSDAEGIVQDFNPRAAVIFGWSREETLRRSLADMAVPPRLLTVFKKHLEAASRQGRDPLNDFMEVYALRGNGEEFPMEISTSVIETPHGKFLSTFCRDITSRKRAERALRESEERYRLLFENNLTGVFRTTLDGRSLTCNQALANMLGYDSPLEVLAHPVLDFYFSEGERHKFLEKLNTEGGLSNFEIRLRRKDGSPLWAIASANYLTLETGAQQVIQGTLVNITERKRAEAAMAERHRLATLLAEVGVALTGAESLRQGLQRCAEVLVRDIDAAFARVWTINEKEDILELQASAGMYTRIDGGHARVPLGKFKIGRIAQTGEPHLTNTVLEDSWVGDPEWARREGLVAFAGYPLKVEEKVLGVVAAFARHPLTEATLQAFASVSHGIAMFIERKQAEEALRESEERYRLLFERNLAGVFRGTLLSRRILDCNDAYARILGYNSRQEVLKGGRLHDFYEPAEFETAKACLRQEKTLTNFEARFCRKDRTPVWALVNVSLIEGDGGKEPLVEGTLIDITERKQAEQALAQERDLLRTLMDNVPDCIYFKDRQSRFLRANVAVAKLFGLSDPGQAVGKTDFDFFTTEHAQQAYNDEQEVICTGKPMMAKEEKETWPDGRVTWASTVKMPFRDAGGAIIGTFGISRDITERKRAEEALRESEARYRRLFERNLAAVFQGTLDGHILDCNDAYARILGYNSRQDILRLEKLDYFYDAQEGMAAATVLQREGSQTNFEIRLKRRDGSPVSVLANVTLTEMGKGRPPLVEGTLIDISERNRAEEQTRLQTAALESAANGIVIVGRDGRVLWVNPAFTRLTGYSGEEVLGQTMRVLKSGHHNAKFYHHLWQTILAGGVWQGEIVNRRKDGSLYTDETTITPVRDAAGTITHFIAVKQDVTERQRAARALEERTTYLNTLIETSPLGIVVFDTEGRVQMCNPAFEKLFLYSRRELQAANLDELIIPSELASEAQGFTMQCLCGASVHAISRRRRKDASQVDVEIYSMPLAMEGKPRGVLALYQDITERKRAEQALRASEGRYRELFENASELVFTADLETTRLTSLNRVAEQTFGYSREEAVRMEFQQLIDPRHWHRIGEARARLLTGESAVALELEIRAQDGRRVLLEVKPRLIYKEGKPVEVQVIGRDITGREAAEMELRQAQKLESVGRLASGIAHEINTPIQFVGDNTRFLQDSFAGLHTLLNKYQELRDAAASGAVSPELLAEVRRVEEGSDCAYLLEEIPKALTQTLEGVSRVATIVRAMKDFAHPESKEKAAADLNKALLSTLTVARNELKYVADVETDFGDLPLVVCNISDLNQVFLNLLVNAAHAIGEVVKGTGEKGKIRVRTGVIDKTVLVTISDTGCGIPEAHRNKIFDPFFTTKEVGRGTGQGLAIARSVVVDRHKGSLTFESEVGKGTTFYIRLPLDSAECPEGATLQ
jgi:PAS domain S-box-containing protein